MNAALELQRARAAHFLAIGPARRNEVVTLERRACRRDRRCPCELIQHRDDTAAELVDSVQGLNGLAGAVAELPPGRDTQFQLAFAVSESPVQMQLSIQPGGRGQDAATLFEGQA